MKAKRIMRECVARSLLWSGISGLVRRVLWGDKVAILLYHDPSPESLDRHLTYLSRTCEFISLADVNSPSNGKPRVVITLDDGHAGNVRLLPIFIKHKVYPTIFICTGIVGSRTKFWWQRERARLGGIERLKRLPNEERLAYLQAQGFLEHAEDASSALSLDDIETMKPWVDFQAHTRSHPILPLCNDAECESEISLSRTEVEKIVGSRCTHFAFPNGNYGPREIAILKASGYQSARTCDLGWNDTKTDPFRLKGIPVDDEASPAWLAAKLTGIPLYLRYAVSGSFNGKMPQFKSYR